MFSEQEPCDWRPWQVLHPDSGIEFTSVSAWNFIADLLESDHEVKEVLLKKPPGKLAYEIIAQGYHKCPSIYIKVTFSHDKIHGRSFHNSEY